GISEREFGRVFLHIGLIVGLLALPMGRLADYIGKPQAIRLGLVLCAAGMWSLPFLRAIPLLTGAAALFGLGFLLASPAWLALLTQLAGERHRGGVVGIVNTAQGVGASLGVYVGSRLYEGSGLWQHVSGPRSPFVGSAILFTLSVLLVFWSFRAVARGDGLEVQNET
ncbi:MAG: MFS transporter, partial [Armatimonadota bacterium]|nr:MFS transporter [Armatimonadota bacterium]